MHTFPFTTKVEKNNEMQLQQLFPIRYTASTLHKTFSYLRSGLRIGKASIISEKPLTGSENDIIRQIHEIRYNPGQNQYVITGGHFSQLFVRNLGVFFNAMLDPHIPSTAEDWADRQRIVLQTLALDLEVFSQSQALYTTIVPLNHELYTTLNLYAYPSDALFAILYTLCAMTDETFISASFPYTSIHSHALHTKTAARKLFTKYQTSLQTLLGQYKEYVTDTQTGLIREDICLSSARDGIKRQSSFYDNVIYWATLVYADRLGIAPFSRREKDTLKQKIINTFWDDTAGIFLDDLSDASKKHKTFSADCLIAVSTGFLNPGIPQDRLFLKNIVSYIQNNRFDRPFPLRYSSYHDPKLLYNPVRFSAPGYMTKSIWCHWGMEYIKLLLLLSGRTNTYLQDAQKHLDSYSKNIITSGGYPELYDLSGSPLRSHFYKSVLHNGWVINYEQTKAMYASYSLKNLESKRKNLSGK